MLGAGRGVLVGHWTDEKACTGCTVVVFPEGTTASGEIRGGAPATRDFALLAPERTVTRLDAVVMSGGSAFGLAAADGVMRWCEEQDRGFETRGGRVPIVVGISLYDLTEGDGSVRPGPDAGYAAARSAADALGALGRVGAGAGATMDKWRGAERRKAGGLGNALLQVGDVLVGALVAVNAAGEVNSGAVQQALADGAYEHQPAYAFAGPEGGEAHTSTTIGVVATNAALDKPDCFRVARSGHSGMARALLPVHTDSDGDALVAAATGAVKADIGLVRLMAAAAVEAAIRSVATPAATNH
ncbi:MAG: P1 family peptidase [bacterium]|nr:P1 family peptidase [bacterium]